MGTEDLNNPEDRKTVKSMLESLPVYKKLEEGIADEVVDYLLFYYNPEEKDAMIQAVYSTSLEEDVSSFIEENLGKTPPITQKMFTKKKCPLDTLKKRV